MLNIELSQLILCFEDSESFRGMLKSGVKSGQAFLSCCSDHFILMRIAAAAQSNLMFVWSDVGKIFKE